MMSVWEAAWVIARRDFVATVYSRAFILFLAVPLLVFAAVMAMSQVVDEAQRDSERPLVAVIADTMTTQSLSQARDRLARGTLGGEFPVLQPVAPAENVAVQAARLLADEEAGYSAIFSGTLARPVLTGPEKVEQTVGETIRLLVEDARRAEALAEARLTPPPAPLERVVTAEAAGNLQLIRRDIARGVMSIIFGVTVLLATLMLSNLTEEKTNKVIEVLAAAVPLDAVFLGKLVAMLGTSFVGLALWGGMVGLAYLFVQVVQDWVTLPQSGPAVGWLAFALLVFFYYGANFMILGAFFLGVGGQASNIREVQTLTMPVSLLQAAMFMLALMVVGRDGGALAWFAYVFPFSSPLAMIGVAATSETLWPHLVALAWQAAWVVIIIRISARMFRLTVLKSSSSGPLFSLGFRRGRRAG